LAGIETSAGLTKKAQIPALAGVSGQKWLERRANAGVFRLSKWPDQVL
jgi:hypothetical protein